MLKPTRWHLPKEFESSDMDSPPPPSPPVEDATRDEQDKEILHRTKVMQFFGRTAPIILQNDNGPCPLLAICNVLSLKNSLNLSPDVSEVSQEKLLSLVAERLIDSNANVDNKDAGYVENQQQNIADAIDLLPRLTTGIDVNIKFRRIDDFEFTRECAIFDLLDIPLYHGWIVDPQDHETADAIGSKSYNTLMGELVSLETQTMEDEEKQNSGHDDVDFVAATTAALGVPSPSLSRGQSFDESPHKARKGDREEEAELLRVLKLSEVEMPSSLANGVADDISFHESACAKSEPITHLENVEEDVSRETVNAVISIPEDVGALNDHQVDIKFPEVVSEEVNCSFLKTDQWNSSVQPFQEESKEIVDSIDSNARIESGNIQLLSLEHEPSCTQDNEKNKLMENQHTQNEIISSSETYKPGNHQSDCKEKDSTGLLNTLAGSDSANGLIHNTDDPSPASSNVDNNEPIYEGEECILDLGTQFCDNREPVYEGEVVLAEQVDKGCMDDGGLNSTEILSTKQGEIIRNFLKITASQLTIYGLFCLQDKVKERELCVFFRNNHFNTMFKYEGELFILVTDQGYINQPDLVWEKLNEVNGDTVYMTADFKEFKMDDQSDSTWNAQKAMDYIAGIDSTQENLSFNSDLQLAMALQQQEYEQQQQQQHNLQQPDSDDGSKLVTGPEVSHSSEKHASPSSKPESPKTREKCILM